MTSTRRFRRVRLHPGAPAPRTRLHRDRGVTMVVLALSLTGLLALTGLAVDGGRVYALRRQMQNSADASSMAGARQLDMVRTGQSTNAASIRDVVINRAVSDGANAADVVCVLTDLNQQEIQACPTSGSTVPGTALGVKAKTKQGESTFFMQIVGTSTYTANGEAIAQIGKPLNASAPFLVCGTSPNHPTPLLINPTGANPPAWDINPAAISTNGSSPVFYLWGNDIKKVDCGNPSSSYRGLVDQDEGPYGIPGVWQADQGNKNGPTLALVNAGDVCQGRVEDFTQGCIVVLPLCDYGNNSGGNGFDMHCVDLGLFKLTQVGNHDIRGVFLGRATITAGQLGGAPDANGARIIQLVK